MIGSIANSFILLQLEITKRYGFKWEVLEKENVLIILPN
jgi:hypothetical protein